MGIQIPPGLKPKATHRIVIKLTGKLSKANAAALKKELNRVLDKYRSKTGGITPPPRKGKSKRKSKRTS